MAERVAAIDIGTNSVILTIVEARDGEVRVLLDQARITRLGEGVGNSGVLAPLAISRTLSCLADFAAAIKEASVDRMAVVGTSALRDARGGAEFCLEVKERLGIEPQVIGGLEEARLTFRGALMGLDVPQPTAVFDLGGGSLELVCGGIEGVLASGSAVSLNLGCVRSTERWISDDPPTADQIRALRLDARRLLGTVSPPGRDVTLVGVAGTVTTLAALDLGLPVYDGARIHGHRLSHSTVETLLADLAAVPRGKRAERPCLGIGRADVIVAGAAIVSELLSWTGHSEFVVSDRGVRWGLVWDLLSVRAS